jgi:Protein of unknown function (DUF1194)
MRLAFLCLVATLRALAGAPEEELRVDIELVLAVDVSDSMDRSEQSLQRRGYATALVRPGIAEAIARGSEGRIAVTYVEWAGPWTQRVVVPWTVIDGAESARGFAAQLEGPVQAGIDGTSLSAAMQYASLLFEGNGYSGWRRTIDISGDGVNNAGPPVLSARDRVARKGITINGLPIILPSPTRIALADLEAYYRDCVVAGDDGFIVPARSIAAFEEAIYRKLYLEIAAAGPTVVPASGDRRAAASDCLIGEKLGGRLGDP